MKNIEALDGQAMAQIRVRQAIITQHQIVINALEREIMTIVQQSSGVDVFNEHWEIDLERGILRKVEEKTHEERDCAP